MERRLAWFASGPSQVELDDGGGTEERKKVGDLKSDMDFIPCN
jgi:hypothetical protein